MTTGQEVVLDDRRRTSFARVGRKDHSRYLVEEYPDGTIILKPSVTITQAELDLLRNPAFMEGVRQTFDPSAQRRRRPAPE
jgi:hypothetical protein